MKYIVNEIQTGFDGQVSNLVTVYDDRLDAESAYHMILAAAAKSNLLLHAAVILTNDGVSIMRECYTHPIPAPEPNTNE